MSHQVQVPPPCWLYISPVFSNITAQSILSCNFTWQINWICCMQSWRIKHIRMKSSQALCNLTESNVQTNISRSYISHLQINIILSSYLGTLWGPFSITETRKRCLITVWWCLFCWVKPQQQKPCNAARFSIFIQSKK